ncbi:MAG: hypothetical protein KAX49_17705 [Halanaerobiales bacterium]|nr:hypothetical protein [Halanaerobiales bacterium]
MTREESIRIVIDSFFRGGDYFDEPEIGFIWIAKHGLKEIKFDDDFSKGYDIKIPAAQKRLKNGFLYPEFETLTIEPIKGGQYEVAIRIWSEGKWRGYMINDFDDEHYLVGINTRGH